MSPPIRIVIADDHQLFRDGLRRLLESEPAFQVVGEAGNGLEALSVVRELAPDILLLDVAMPLIGGVEVCGSLAGSPVRVVLLTAAIEPSDLLRALQAGARGVVLKESASRVLIQGLHKVASGHYLVADAAVDNVVEAVQRASAAAPARYGLTSRELSVVAAIVGGESNRQIADRLGISLQTVKHHLTSVFDKTGTSSRLELALFAIKNSLVTPD